MATDRTFEVLSDKYKADTICTYVISSSHKEATTTTTTTTITPPPPHLQSVSRLKDILIECSSSEMSNVSSSLQPELIRSPDLFLLVSKL